VKFFAYSQTQIKNADLKIGHYKPCLLLGCLGRAAQLRQNFFFAEDKQLFVFDLDFRAAVLAEQHAVTGFTSRGISSPFSRLPAPTAITSPLGASLLPSQDDDSTLDGFFFLDALHDYAIVQRRQIDCHLRKTSVVSFRFAVGRRAGISTPHRRVLI